MIRKFKRTVFVIFAFVTVVIIVFAMRSRYLSKLSKTFQVTKSNLSVKYVLIWTTQKKPLVDLGRGSGTFYKRNCSFKNCHITWDRAFFNNISEFDAIVFHGPETDPQPQNYMPKQRSPNQSYIFASMESSNNYLFDTRYNGMFNFTWTYKLKSDIKFGYITIRNHEGKVIGPKANIPWIRVNKMLPINDTIKTKLANKSIAAAWFVSNCKTRSNREKIASKVITELYKYNMTVDVYGRCGDKQCPRKSMKRCLQKLQRDYYFYFAFENSFSGDYVTEKLLYALQNYAVPIVYGSADYNRFMPDGIYINAKEMSVVKLVDYMIKIIKDKNRYQDFFKWHNHYSYRDPEEAPDTDPYCAFCRFMNNINCSKISTVENFVEWWNRETY